VAEHDNLPFWRGERGRYEVWFLTMSAPDGRSGYWIRYTVRAPIVGPPEPRVWFARFDRDDPGRTFGINVHPETGSKVLASPDEPDERFEIRIGESTLSSGRASGTLAGGGHKATWDLEFATGEPTFRLLPGPLYRGGLAQTKPYTPNPATRFRGTVEVDGEKVTLANAPGQQGHLYGTRHAERWAWAFCGAFEEGDAVFQALSAQGRRGPILTPHLAYGGLRVDGEWIRLRGVARKPPWGLGWWRLRLTGKGHRLEGEIRADLKELVRARYLDPDDRPRWCHNSEIASCRLTLFERSGPWWRATRELSSDGTTHAEWAGRTPATQVETVHTEVP
jgi:hypothetical protein